MIQRFWVFPFLVVAILVITWPLSYATFAWVPVPLFLASILVYAARRPVGWLVSLAILGELFTALPLGVMTGAVFLPYVAKRLVRRMEPDFSIWFFLYLLGITALQVTSLWGVPWIVAAYQTGWGVSGPFLPWPMALVTVLATTTAVFTLLIIRSFSLPALWTR